MLLSVVPLVSPATAAPGDTTLYYLQHNGDPRNLLTSYYLNTIEVASDGSATFGTAELISGMIRDNLSNIQSMTQLADGSLLGTYGRNGWARIFTISAADIADGGGVTATMGGAINTTIEGAFTGCDGAIYLGDSGGDNVGAGGGIIRLDPNTLNDSMLGFTTVVTTAVTDIDGLGPGIVGNEIVDSPGYALDSGNLLTWDYVGGTVSNLGQPGVYFELHALGGDRFDDGQARLLGLQAHPFALLTIELREIDASVPSSTVIQSGPRIRATGLTGPTDCTNTSFPGGNVNPDVAADNAAVTTDEGTDAANTGTYGDVDGDTVTLSADVGNLTDNGDGTWDWDNTAPDGPDSYTVTITADDGNGGTASTSFSVTVNNVDPSVAADNAAVSTDEGTDATNSGTFADVPADEVTITASVGSVSQTGTDAGTWSWSNPAPDGPDGYTVTITATDDDSGTSTATFDITVNNVAPVVDAGPDQTTTFGGTITPAASFTDPGADADWVVNIDWGDSASDSSTASTPGSVAASHQYLSLGEHTVEICVSDKDGATDCDTLTVTVSNTEGKVTGGVSTIDGDGKGGFVVQNKKGEIKGNLQFKDDATNFHAKTMTALAVSEDETSAWFAGVGKDGRSFVAYVEDNGEPNVDDIFRLWIDGVLHGGTGEMNGGNIQTH